MSDNTPDFDNMSPEELMAWMETLAERQGASEGFTTEKRMDIAEVDPNSVDVKDNYIPYGMSEAEWETRKAKEEADKAARRSQQKSAAAAPPPPVPATPPPPAAPQPAAASSSGEPDFDNMSPEELMAWMETLAERQGASEGFTTEKRMDIAEVDPSSVHVKDTYIPYGKTEAQWVEMQAKENAAKEAARAAKLPQESSALEEFEEEPAFELPNMDIDLEGPTEIVSPLEEAGVSGLDWLESLAADQAGDFAQMDLSGLGEELQQLDLGGLAEDNTDPLEWLDSLVQEQQATPAPQPVADDDVDPLEWLESLAKRQGADSEELITGGGLDLPDIEDLSSPASGYTDYTFESPELEAETVDLPGFQTVDELDKPTSDPDDPVAWLEGLAESQGLGHDEEVEEVEEDNADIISRLNKAEDVSPQDMESWMANMLERGASRNDVPDYIEEDEEDEEVIQGNIPDWLIDQIGPPPEIDAMPQSVAPSLDDIFDEGEAEAVESNIPEWLQDSGTEDVPDDIFAAVEDITDATSTDELLIDSNDPWVEAFEIERRDGLADPNNVPDWYKQRSGQGDEPQPALQQSTLPVESDLPQGELEALPDWLGSPMPMPMSEEDQEAIPSDMSWLQMDEPEEAQVSMPDWLKEHDPATQEFSAVSDDVPDWLKEAGIQETEAIPDWLMETMEDNDQSVVTEQPVEKPLPVQQQFTPPAKSPAPVVVSNIDVAAVLQSAREKIKRGDADGSLQDYEAIVRSNAELDVVVAELDTLVKGAYKHNAAVYRVLGDGLMRQGKLQDALDTYRKALNLL